ncbi:MAG: 50S ribosomal protein L25/general stress protein Ctc [Aquificae bacterium]|jgi:large subunit ribosomal protein L25|nr:50S ribosomal protein L25/general stress protein Ctc [Aquificota bacterium]
MRRIPLKAIPRKIGRKSELKRMRKQGWLPAEVYGKGVENLHVYISKKDFEKLPHGEAYLINLEVEGEKEPRVCIVKEVQTDWTGTNPIHVDLQDLTYTAEIEAEIPVHVVGTPKGIEKGGTLEIVMPTITVKAPPAKLPEQIVIDVSNLDLGDVIYVKDLPVPEGTKIVDNPDEVVIVLLEPEEEKTEGEETQEGEEATS